VTATRAAHRVADTCPALDVPSTMVDHPAWGGHADLTARGIEVRGVDELAWGRFVYFSDPDGNGWAMQELPDYAAGA
jgi:hypothetical protein